MCVRARARVCVYACEWAGEWMGGCACVRSCVRACARACVCVGGLVGGCVMFDFITLRNYLVDNRDFDWRMQYLVKCY